MIVIRNNAESWDDRTKLMKDVCAYLHDYVIRVDSNCLAAENTISFYGVNKKWAVVRFSDKIEVEAPPEHESFLALKYGVS